MDGLSSDISPELTLTPQTATFDSPPAIPRSSSNGSSDQFKALPSRPKLYLSESSPATTQPRPTLTIDPPPMSPTAAVPVRISSLSSGPRHRSGLSPTGSARMPGPRHGPPPSRNLTLSPGDSSRLRVQHRSTASSSEPHLPLVDEIRNREHSRTVRLIPSAANVRPHDTIRGGSQQDLPTTRFPTGGLDETGDAASKGKELAARCWNEDEDFLAKEKIAEWLGSLLVHRTLPSSARDLMFLYSGEINKAALHQYMENFDFASLRLDQAFRCGPIPPLLT